MRFSTAAVAASAASLAAAAPFSFPLADGFPNLNSTALAEVYKLAGGTLPNGALPSNLTASATQTLQLIAANEIFEVAYFTELLSNVTNKVSGYDDIDDYDYVVRTLTAVVNQEQVHAYGANAILANAGKTTIQPCEYTFPVDNFDDAIALAETFTEVVLGVLPVAQTVFAKDGGSETGLVQVIGSILAQEGEQVGYYRFLQKKVASSAPLLTGDGPQFAYTAISQFIVSGTCPNINVIGLTAFPSLTVENTPKAQNTTLLYSIAASNISSTSASIAYLSGQNVPVVVPISDVTTSGGKTYFFASFPYDAGFARGLTVGALVNGYMPTLANASQVASYTLAGPALIDVD